KARVKSTSIDTLYPKRIKHIDEMNRMGGNIKSENGVITVGPADKLTGTTVEADEIRAGVSLVGLAMMSEGLTTILKADNILRGYDRIVEKFHGLHVELKVVTTSDQLETK